MSMVNTLVRPGLAVLALSAMLVGQQPPPTAPRPALPPGFGSPLPLPLPPAQTPPVQTLPPIAGQPVPAPGAATAPGATPAPAAAGTPTVYGGLSLNNVSLTEVIDSLARQLKINYVLDPRVKGGVSLSTYGETKNIDTRSLLETILRINGFGIVKQGDLYRIVPLTEISHLPVPLERSADSKDIPEDDRTMLNLVFLKYATADELAKVMDPFLGENARAFTYAPANMIFLLDSRRNMRRLMELVSLFDSDSLANQRVRLFEVKNGQPTDIVKELEGIVKSISLNDKNAPIKFLPVNRINTIIAVAPNPGAFAEVEKWILKLDVPVKITAGSVDNYVYRMKYGQAQLVGSAISMLYGGYGGGGYGQGGFGQGGFGQSGFGQGGFGQGGFGGGGYGGGGYGGGGGGGYPGGGSPFGQPGAPGTAGGSTGGIAGGVVPTGPGGGTDLTGNYMGYGQSGGMSMLPRVIPNPLDNTLLIQATPQQYEGILKLLRDLDVPPRQVLIEAKIYEVSLTGSFASGVSAYLQQRGASAVGGGAATAPAGSARAVLGSLVGAATNLTAGALVGRSRELLGFLQLQETEGRSKVISAPSIIATDSIAASINVGTEVPTLTAQAVTGVQVGGSSAFANTISNRQSGVTLTITARINPSGIVTLVVNQEVSSPVPAAAGGIQSPSFAKRTITTQVTVQDGDTIAIGGIINESNTLSTSGLPFFSHLPWIGGAFGNRSTSKERTELIVFMTPRVIYDMNDVNEASDELKARLKKLRKIVKE